MILFRFAVSLLVILLLFFVGQISAAPEMYKLDPAQTHLHFAVSYLGFSTIYGCFDQVQGRFSIDREARAASVDVAIKTASISTGLKERDDHLRSPDFFNVAEFSVATFKSTSVRFAGDIPAVIEGNLTLLGITRRLTFTITAFGCGMNSINGQIMCGIGATANMKRSSFGMKYALPIVGDEIKLMIEATGYQG